MIKQCVHCGHKFFYDHAPWGEVNCPECGGKNKVPYTKVACKPRDSKRRFSITLLLVIFFGEIGAHRFYAGKIGSGILYLFTCGLLFVGWFRDIKDVITKNFYDQEGDLICKG